MAWRPDSVRRVARDLAVVVALVGSAAAGCIGNIGDGGDGQEPRFSPEELETGISPLRRLTRYEYESTLRDLFGDAHVDALSVEIAGLPSDQKAGQFTTMASGITSQHVDGFYFAADALSDRLSQDAAALAALEPCLGSPAIDAACLGAFFDGFGRRMLRRPVAAEERASFSASHQAGAAVSDADGTKLLLMHMLLSPAFLYRLELGTTPLQGVEGIEEIDGWALATRLSYLAWGSTPDVELLDAAERGDLATEQGLDAQIDRLLAQGRAHGWVGRFFGEWLSLDSIPGVQQSDAFVAGLPRDTLVDDARTEALALIEHHLFIEPTSYAMLLSSKTAFIPSAGLAQLYGVAMPSSPDGRTELDDTRAGLLTRAALLMGQGESTHPIARGARVRKKLLCEDIEPPDPTAFPPNTIQPPAFDPNKTARERWTDKTSAPACAVCHGFINPVGYALERYDTLGRYRTLEPVIDPSSGQMVSELTIDDAVDVQLDTGTTTVQGAGGLSAALGTSGAAARCFSRQWLRYALGRFDSGDDNGVVAAMTDAGAGDTGSMVATLRQLARAPQFRLRRIEP